MLTTEMLQEYVPAAFANRHSMSDRYVQVPTHKVIAGLTDAGFVPVQAQQDKPLRRDPLHVSHKIVLRHEDDLAKKAKVGEEVPQIMLLNSHNGRTKMRLFAGFYRFICANGLVVGDDAFRHEVRHVGDALAETLSFAEQMVNDLNDLRGKIERWSQVELSQGRAESFAQKAAELRWGMRANSYKPGALLEARRTEDEGRTLWKVFNTVQENVTKGGIEGQSANGRKVKTRQLTGIHADLDINRNLWNLAEEFAQAA